MIKPVKGEGVLQHSKGFPWEIYLLTGVVFMLGTAQFGMVGVLDEIATSTGLSLAEVGRLYSLYSLANAFATPLIMISMARQDRHRLLTRTLALMSLACLGTAYAQPPLTLMGLRALMGASGGVFYVTALFYASRLAAPGRQASAIATVITGFSASLILGVPVGRLIATAYHWQILYLGVGLGCLLAMGAIARFLPTLQGEAPVPLKAQWALLKQRRILTALLVSFTLFTGYETVYTYITPYISALTAVSSSGISSILLGYGFATLLGSRLGGALADRWGVPITLLSGLLVHVLLLILMSLLVRPSILFVALPLLWSWGIVAWTAGPVLNFNLVSQAPEASGVLLSLNASFVQLGLASGAMVGAEVLTHYTVDALGWFAAAIVTLAAVLSAFNLKWSRAAQKTALLTSLT